MFKGYYILRNEGKRAFLRAFILLSVVVLSFSRAFASDADSLWVSFTSRETKPFYTLFTWETYTKPFNGEKYSIDWHKYEYSDSISYLVSVYTDSLYENVYKTMTVTGKEVKIDSLKVNTPYWFTVKPDNVPNPFRLARTEKRIYFHDQPVKEESKYLKVLEKTSNPLNYILFLSIALNIILLFLVIIKKKQGKL